MTYELRVNGARREVDCDPMRRLIDVLREDLGLTGTKEGCGEGECGACSVLIGGRLATSCLIPIAQVTDLEITTIEGFRETDVGKTLTESFSATHAVQCGFCSPGMVMAAGALLSRNPDPDEQAIREAISGNLCRCTGYDMIVDGIERAAATLRGGGRQ